MESLVVILSLVSIFVLFIITQRNTRTRTRSRTPLPPGPKGLPLIGNLHQLDAKSPHHYFRELSKHYGPIMSFKLGSTQALVISSSKLAKEVLKTHDLKFASRPPYLGLRKLSYNGLDLGFAPYSPYWREMKKLCVLHFFSSQRVHSFRPFREQEVANMIRRISQHEDSNKVVNLSDTLMFFTNTLICRVAFGKEYGNEYHVVDEELGCGQRSKLQVLLNEAQALLVEFYFSDHFPMLGWVDWLRGILWRLDKNFKELDKFYERVIFDHMDSARANKSNEQQVKDIIDIFLEMMNDHSLSFDLTLDHIKAVLMNIFIAGTDPSAGTTVWAMNELLKNPKAMKKLQSEIRGLFGDKDFINEDDIQRLPYLKAVIKETLRMFPPSPLLLPRETIETCNIEGYEIKPKTLVYVNAWAIARDPKNWKDPEEFCPERFIENPIDLKGNDFELIPFGSGRRICPAMNMGLVTIEIALANIVHSFDWSLPIGFDNEEMFDTQVKPGITMHKKNDLFLVAKKHVP
ncbi:cytochrome P450 83B1-like [Arachis stenosperma]|uniref:cytochrome P450 83B1-like n=1 Tax=Arachis stenosperma TaxID=217475 RepID=UPI0025AC60DB|nr:cytochrome P450 83B1-like [Arachis stenosperma]